MRGNKKAMGQICQDGNVLSCKKCESANIQGCKNERVQNAIVQMCKGSNMHRIWDNESKFRFPKKQIFQVDNILD